VPESREVIRVSRPQSIPEHYESMNLKPAVRALGWSVALLGVAAGLTVAGAAEGVLAEIVGPVAVILGGIVLGAVWQCRRYEITVGTARIDIGTGPFRDTLSAGAVESTSRCPATGWRRLFADHEVAVRVTIGHKREYSVPTHDPDTLESSLRAQT
jgi:hypothetical protein